MSRQFSRSGVLAALLMAMLVAAPGCGGGGNPVGPGTGTPARVTDLRVVTGAAGSVTLAWTVPVPLAAAAAAGKSGSLTYDLRYVVLGQEGLDRALWTAAPAPTGSIPAGQVQQHVVTGLIADSTYIFSLAARYGDGNWSAASLPAVGTAAAQTDRTPPARPSDLVQHAADATSVTVAWSLAGDDSIYGRAAGYEVRWAAAPLSDATWEAATPVAATPQPHPNPDKLVATITGLPAATTIHVGLKALDDAGNASALSNLVAVQVGSMRTFYVRQDGTGDFATINQAISAALPGDVVLVAPGRYTWTNQGDGDALVALFIVNRDQTDFTIRGEGGAGATILDAEDHSRVLCVVGGTFGTGDERTWAGVTIEGFTFTNGRALGTAGETGPPWSGAGMILHLTDTLVRDCVFRGNQAKEGAGVWMGGQGAARLQNCLIEDNVAEAGGGAFLVNSDPVMSVSGCTIRGNLATIAGGGLYAYNVGLRMDTTVIHDNTAADRGGGLYLGALHAGSGLEGCSIIGNASPIASAVRTATTMNVELRRCLVARNRGGAAFASIDGGVLAAGCGLVFANAGGNGPPADYVDLGGNLAVDPLLCADGLHPSTSSPCLPGNRAGADACGLIGALAADCGK